MLPDSPEFSHNREKSEDPSETPHTSGMDIGLGNFYGQGEKGNGIVEGKLGKGWSRPYLRIVDGVTQRRGVVRLGCMGSRGGRTARESPPALSNLETPSWCPLLFPLQRLYKEVRLRHLVRSHSLTSARTLSVLLH